MSWWAKLVQALTPAALRAGKRAGEAVEEGAHAKATRVVTAKTIRSKAKIDKAMQQYLENTASTEPSSGEE